MKTFDFVTTPIEPGLTVIEASAGTGKTFAISHLLPRMLLDGTLQKLSECLLVTFTNDAAGELAERVRKVLNLLALPPAEDEGQREPGIYALRQQFPAAHVEQVIGKALLEVDRLSVCTIHSYCLQVLQTEGAQCGLPVIPELTMADGDLLNKLVRDYWETDIANSRALTCLKEAGGWNLENDIQFCRNALPYPDATFSPQAPPLEETISACAALFAQKKNEDLQDFRTLYLNLPRAKGIGKNTHQLEQYSHLLDSADSVFKPGVITALKCFKDAEGWSHQGSKAGKQAAQQLKEHPIRIWAEQLIDAMSQSKWQHQQALLNSIRPRMRDWLQQRRWITFDGLISSVHAALYREQGNEGLPTALRARHRIALIDESQDTDPQQFAIFQKVFLDAKDPCRLVLIGDPKQAIYAFRGADLNTYLSARKLAGDRVFSLNRTFRAPPKLVSAVNAVFQGEQSFLNADLVFQPAQSGMGNERWLQGDPSGAEAARMEVWLQEETPDGKPDGNNNSLLHKVAQATAARIAHILQSNAQLCKGSGADGDVKSEPVHPGHFAVLVGDRFEAQKVFDALHERRIPAVRAGAQDLFASEEANELLTILRALQEPRRFSLVCAALATRLLGYDAAQIADLEDGADAVLEDFMLWREIWVRSGIAAAIMAMDAKMSISLNLARLPQAERSLTNFRQLIELLQETAAEHKNRPDTLLRWFAGEIQSTASNASAEERQMRLESDARAVNIVTMHASKGLEYPLVFCLSLAKFKSSGETERLDLPDTPPCFLQLKSAPAEQIEALQKAGLADRIRLTYVAITRAQVKLWVLAGQNQGSKSAVAAPLDWLLSPGDPEQFTAWQEQAPSSGRCKRHRQGLLAKIAANSLEGIIDIKPLPEGPKVAWEPTLAATSAEFHAKPAPPVPSAWGQTSFSAITKEKSPFAGPDEPRTAGPSGTMANAFARAARGTAVGTAVHDWIEQWDFSEPNPEAISAHLAKYSLPKNARNEEFAAAVLDMLTQLRSAHLPGLGCTLAEACPDASASEWNFLLPVSGKLQPATLATIFARHGYQDYADILLRLPAESVSGFLTGFMDRLVYHKGQWGVIDWKTNDLGADASLYSESALHHHIRHHHYLLQSVLYLVALRRFIGPSAPLIGAWVVYLRGISANTSQGILHVHPPEALLSELSGCFI